MRGQFFKTMVSFSLIGASVFLMTGCSEKKETSKYKDEITINVFDSQANFEGVQTGWFAKIVKDKFNMKLNITAPNLHEDGNASTLFQSYLTNNSSNDLILTSAMFDNLNNLTDSDLLYDFKDKIDDYPYLKQYESQIQKVSSISETSGYWAIPSEITLEDATSSSEATNSTFEASLRWDLYGAVGYPKLSTLEDLIPVLSDMKKEAEKQDPDNTYYGFSLFNDWDNGMAMQNANSFLGLYGYTYGNTLVYKVDGTDMQSLLDKDGIYLRILRFLFRANQAGLVDPESPTQNFTDVDAKYRKGTVLYSLWNWLGAERFHSKENLDAGKGYCPVFIDDMTCLSIGSAPDGNSNFCFMIGANAQDPERMLDFVNWLYSPEGIEANCSTSDGTCGPEGLTWEMKDNQPVLTDFGTNVFVSLKSDTLVPEKWGGGTWKEGVSQLNIKPVRVLDMDTARNMCYSYCLWDDYQKQVENPLIKDWKSKMNTTKNPIEFFKDTNHLIVNPGIQYTSPTLENITLARRKACIKLIEEYSWKMVFAQNQKEFDILYQTLVVKTKELDFEKILELEIEDTNNKFQVIKEALGSN
jgi:multiple sugar transport system substrate-binding protein/putative aldouronate transport system substrate-binding protein